MSELLEIELFFGRRREQIWGPRILDLDILFLGNQLVNSENVDIPHPQIAALPLGLQAKYDNFR
jgi:2-amino-4-hydroxy-6-hydroxymethyldihydropteridine diphosphokinase